VGEGERGVGGGPTGGIVGGETGKGSTTPAGQYFILWRGAIPGL